MSSKENKGCSIEFNFSGLIFTLLTIFVVLKLTHIIAWSWWWVLSPIWIPFPLLALAWGIIWITAKLLDKALMDRRLGRGWKF